MCTIFNCALKSCFGIFCFFTERDENISNEHIVTRVKLFEVLIY